MADQPQVDILDEPRIVFDDRGGGDRGLEIATEGLDSVAKTLVDQRVRKIDQGLSKALDNDTNEWWTEQRATQEQPPVADVFNVSKEELANAPEAVQAMMQEVARQRLASEQGAISATELKVRHEKTLREYLNRYPQLTQELQQAAGTAIGYNPLGAHIEQLVESLRADHAASAAQWSDLDNYANAVGVNMTLKTVSPVDYYTQVMSFAKRDTEYEFAQRELNIVKVGKEHANIAATDLFKRTVGPNIMGRAGGLVSKILNMVTSAGMDKATFASDALPAIRREMANFNLGTRAKLMTDFPDLTDTQVDAFMKPIEQALDLAGKSASPEEMSTVLRLFQTQAEAKVYAQYPETAGLKIAADLLRDLPAVQNELQKSNLMPQFITLIHKLGGADTILGAVASFDPTLHQEETRATFYKGAIDGVAPQLDLAKNDPARYVVVKAGVIQAMDWLRTEDDKLDSGGSKAANQSLLNMWQNPESANIFTKGQPTQKELARLPELQKFALDMLRHEAVDAVRDFQDFRVSKATTGFFGSPILDNRPGGGAQGPVRMGDLLDVSVASDGTVHFKADWKAVNLDESRIPKDTKRQVERAMNAAEARLGARMSQSIRMLAHMQGSTNYTAVAGAYSEELKRPIIEAILLPSG